MNTTDGIRYYSVNETGDIISNYSTNINISVTLVSTNSTENTSNISEILVSPYKPWEQIFIAIALAILIIGTIIGNSVVCLAVAMVKGLRTPYNLLIISLAISDLLVALLVMPFCAMYQILGYWPLGGTVCAMWTSLDVTLCTASILNLCMISVDRYFVITRPFTYVVKRKSKHIAMMIAGVWIACAVISIPPLFGWRSENPPNHCIISQHIGYQIYATVGAFYLPLIVMIVVYVKIWRVSARLAKHENKKVGNIDRVPEQISLTNCKIVSNNNNSVNCQIANKPVKPGGNVTENEDTVTSASVFGKTIRAHKWTLKSLFNRSRITSTTSTTTSSIKRKTTKSLGVIMGCFIICWLPFFILAVIRPILGPSAIPDLLSALLTWLGYVNSFLNPIIYVRYNHEFRTPFKEILCFRCRNIDQRIRSENYAEQYGPAKRTRIN